jgi:hypothetical protein
MSFDATSGTTYQYTFRWSHAEHVRAQRATLRYMRGGWKFTVLPVAVAALLMLLIASPAVFGARSWDDAWPAVLPYAMVLVFLVIMVRWATPWLAARRVERNDPSVKGEFRHVIADGGMAIHTVAARVQLTWEHLANVVETPEFFLFYPTPHTAYFTPKRVIPASDLPALRDTIRAHVGNRARLLSSNRPHEL